MRISVVCSGENAVFRFDEDVYVVSASTYAMLEIHHGDVLVTRQQLVGQGVDCGHVLAFGSVDGIPCVVAATYGEGSGVYIHHALTGELMRSLPFRDDVRCVCIDRSGTKVVFGTQSGVWVRVTCTFYC